MPDRSNEDFRTFLRRLRQLRIAGDAARIQIVDRLAKMTLDELRKVPPWVIVRLGPRGLALLAERSRVIRVRDGGSPKPAAQARPVVTKVKRKPSWLADLMRRRPLWWECCINTAVMAVGGLAVILAFPLAQRAVPMIAAAGPIQGACGQLDRWTGDCTYAVGSNEMSLTVAADRLALPVAALAAANPTLDPARPLRRGTLIAVPHRSGINLR